MIKTRMSLLFLALILLSTSAFAETYSWEDEEGNLHFTDDISKVPHKTQKKILDNQRNEDSVKRAKIKKLCKVYPEYEYIYYERIAKCQDIKAYCNNYGSGQHKQICLRDKEREIDKCESDINRNIAGDAAKAKTEAELRANREERERYIQDRVDGSAKSWAEFCSNPANKKMCESRERMLEQERSRVRPDYMYDGRSGRAL